jgi:hypothetical protein
MQNIIIDDADVGMHYVLIAEIFVGGEWVDCFPWGTKITRHNDTYSYKTAPDHKDDPRCLSDMVLIEISCAHMTLGWHECKT